MSTLEGDDLRWALQRRIEDVFAKLGEKFGDQNRAIVFSRQPPPRELPAGVEWVSEPSYFFRLSSSPRV